MNIFELICKNHFILYKYCPVQNDWFCKEKGRKRRRKKIRFEFCLERERERRAVPHYLRHTALKP